MLYPNLYQASLHNRPTNGVKGFLQVERNRYTTLTLPCEVSLMSGPNCGTAGFASGPDCAYVSHCSVQGVCRLALGQVGELRQMLRRLLDVGF